MIDARNDQNSRGIRRTASWIAVALVLFLASKVQAQDFDQWITHQGFHSYACHSATIPANGQLEEIEFDTAFPLTTDTWLYHASGDFILTNPNPFAVPFTEFFTIYVGGYPYPTYSLYAVTKTLQIEANSVGQQFDYHGITSYAGSTYPGPFGTEDFAVYVAVPSTVGGKSVAPLGCVRIEDFTTENNCNKNYPTLGGC